MNESEGLIGGGGETQGRQKLPADPGESAIVGTFLWEPYILAFLLGEDRSTLGRTTAEEIQAFACFDSLQN
jgi:hypothetical protein